MSTSKAEKNRKRRERREKERYRLGVIALWSTSEGRKVMWDYIEFMGPMLDGFDKNPYQMAWNNGMSNAGRRLMDDAMQHCPDAYAKARTERKRDLDLAKSEDEDPVETETLTPEEEDSNG